MRWENYHVFFKKSDKFTWKNTLTYFKRSGSFTLPEITLNLPENYLKRATLAFLPEHTLSLPEKHTWTVKVKLVELTIKTFKNYLKI